MTRKIPAFPKRQGSFFGTPDAIRTHDLQSRSLTLYPAELQAHIGKTSSESYLSSLMTYLL